MLSISFWGKNRAIAALGVVLLAAGIYAGLRGDADTRPAGPFSAAATGVSLNPAAEGRKERDLIDLAVNYALRHPPVLIDVAALSRKAEAGLKTVRALSPSPSPSLSAESSSLLRPARPSDLAGDATTRSSGADEGGDDGIAGLIDHPLQQMAALAVPSLLLPRPGDGGRGGDGNAYFDFPLDMPGDAFSPAKRPLAGKIGPRAEASPSPLPAPRPQSLDDGERISLVSARPLERKLKLDYDLAAVRTGIDAVPAVFLDSLPKALPALQSPQERKRLFIKTLLPLVLAVNEKILADRLRLQSLENRYPSLEAMPAQDRGWVRAMAARYNVDTGKPGVLRRLLQRVDIIPPSLAIAQAAEESGWGTSRFAIGGNALFGQRTWSRGAGLVPGERENGARFEVKAFARLIHAVEGYMLNLNRHAAYGRLRAIRAAMRARGETIDGLSLIAGLDRYSERGSGYQKNLRAIIRANRLRQFDTARLTTDKRLAENEHNQSML